ncbi:hypothetical protein, partial [Streptococcus suis]|uniref:hypothetical protein n=1 Tax=Streptococcus suis TaxID=1307 RepID=UPI003CF9DEEB
SNKNSFIFLFFSRFKLRDMALSENSILNMLNVESDLTNLSKIRISCSTSFTHVLGDISV